MIPKFNSTTYGWISPKTPPSIHNNVVILLYDNENELYDISLGYYENKKWWHTKENYVVRGWFPIPFIPPAFI